MDVKKRCIILLAVLLHPIIVGKFFMAVLPIWRTRISRPEDEHLPIYTARGFALRLPWTWTTSVYVDPWTKKTRTNVRMEHYVTFYFRLLRPSIHPIETHDFIVDHFSAAVSEYSCPFYMPEGERFPAWT